MEQNLIEEYAQKIKEAGALPDSEEAHSRCDDLLLEALEKAGCGLIAEAFKSVSSEFWYA